MFLRRMNLKILAHTVVCSFSHGFADDVFGVDRLLLEAVSFTVDSLDGFEGPDPAVAWWNLTVQLFVEQLKFQNSGDKFLV